MIKLYERVAKYNPVVDDVNLPKYNKDALTYYLEVAMLSYA